MRSPLPRGAVGMSYVRLMSEPAPVGNPPQQPLLVLAKITEILNVFSLSKPSMTLRELRAATGLPASTVQRLVANMVGSGFLDRDGERVRIGMRMAYWAAAASKDYDPITVIRPVLRDLRDSTGETACFFTLEGDQRVCVAMAETHHPLRREMHVGRVLPLSVGSAGRVLLAWSRGVEARLGDALPQITEQSVTDPDELHRLVRKARSDGYAITTGERDDSASGLAAPVFDANSDLVGALMIHGPTLRLPVERCEQLLDPLIEAAERITRTLGGHVPQ